MAIGTGATVLEFGFYEFPEQEIPPIISVEPLEISIKNFDEGSDTENLKAAINTAIELNRSVVIKMDHGVTYNLTETINVPGNQILIDLNKSIITRSTDYGSTFTFGYDITDLNTFRYTFSLTGVTNGAIIAAPGTMTSGYHISFRRVWMAFARDLFIRDGNSGIEFRSCLETRLDNVYIYIIDRANAPSGRVGLWAGSHSNTDFPGSEHRWNKIQIWGGEPWRNNYVGPSLDFGILMQGGDGFWISDSHIAGTKLCNYQISTIYGNFVGNATFNDCMSDWCHGQGVSLSATFGSIVNVRWHGWVSGGPSRFVAEKTEVIIKGASGGEDTLPNTFIGKVRKVFVGNTIYVEGDDFLVDDNKIDWSPAGLEPNTGTTYSVTYTFSPSNVINDGQGIAITSPATTPETTWLIKNIDISGIIEGHARNSIYISSLNTKNIKLSNLNIETNIVRGIDAGGILINRGSNITINDYNIDGSENARYGIRIITNPPTGEQAIGVVDEVTVGTGRIKKCDWYGDSDINTIPGIGLQVTAPATNIVIDGCNAKNNPINLVALNSSVHNFPTIVSNSPGVNPLRYIETWDPGTIDAGDQVKLTISAPGLTYGDFIERISFGMFIDDEIISYAQVSIDSIVVRLENRSTSSATILEGDVIVDVTKKY